MILFHARSLAKKGFTMKAGQLIRFLQIPMFGQYGSFDDLHGLADGGAFAVAAVKNAAKSYGVAGVAWLDKLTQDTGTLAACPAYLDDALKRFAGHGELTPQEARAAKAFALVGLAGELATGYGITGWDKEASFNAALTCFEQWRGYRGVGDTEGLQIRDAITAYVELYGDARFTCTTDDTRLHGERSGYWRDDWEGRQWLFTKAGLQQATKGFDLKQVIAVLKAAGWLLVSDEGRSATKVNFRNNETGEKRLYVIRLSDDVCNAQKQAGTMGTAGTSSNGAACTVPTEKREPGTMGTFEDVKPGDISGGSQSSQSEKTTGNAESRAVIDGSHGSHSSHGKTANTIQVRDRGRI